MTTQKHLYRQHTFYCTDDSERPWCITGDLTFRGRSAGAAAAEIDRKIASGQERQSFGQEGQAFRDLYGTKYAETAMLSSFELAAEMNAEFKRAVKDGRLPKGTKIAVVDRTGQRGTPNYGVTIKAAPVALATSPGKLTKEAREFQSMVVTILNQYSRPSTVDVLPTEYTFRFHYALDVRLG